MNIKMAKEQISDTIDAYLAKNEFGEYLIPVERQRPIFVMGPPGVGKTAIMEQIAAEKDIALVSYTMTHHTRQSALGLPFITKKVYNGKEHSVSEYTMSEIIACIYNTIEATGKTEGILFLDEINCVSETLAPAMLRFLQYKTFGEERVPEGWIVVTAGNPPEYNNSVREFDVVTWDRLKRIDIEADFSVWKEFAYSKGVHGAVVSFLENDNNAFYKIENTANGKRFVTARGWVDLSDIMKVYEGLGKRIDENLLSQYIQDKKIATDFAVYYELFKKYGEDYHVEEILNGKIPVEVAVRIQNAKFDEQITVLGVIKAALDECIGRVYFEEKVLGKIAESIRSLAGTFGKLEKGEAKPIYDNVLSMQAALDRKVRGSSISEEDKNIALAVIAFFEASAAEIKRNEDKTPAEIIRKSFEERLRAEKDFAGKEAKSKLENALSFICNGEYFKNDNISQVFLVNITIDKHYVYFNQRYPSSVFAEKNERLLVSERKMKLDIEIDSFDISGDDDE